MNVLKKLVVVLYGAGLFLGAAAYFSGVVIEYPIVTQVIGMAIAAATIVHGILVQRQVLLGIKQRVKGKPNSTLPLNLGVLLLLVSFDIFVGIEYRARIIYHHDLLPVGVQVVLQGTVVALLFLASSLMAEVDADTSDTLTRASNKMLAKMMKATLRQWGSKLKTAMQSGVDLASITITLLEDADESESARRMRTIANGLVQTTSGKGVSKSAKLYLPSGQKSSRVTGSVVDKKIGLPNGPDSEGKIRPLSGVQNERRRKVRVAVKKTAQDKVFDYLNEHPDASINAIVAATKVAKGTAVKYRNDWYAENGQEVAEG